MGVGRGHDVEEVPQPPDLTAQPKLRGREPRRAALGGLVYGTTPSGLSPDNFGRSGSLTTSGVGQLPGY